jgi:hypothetical protein
MFTIISREERFEGKPGFSSAKVGGSASLKNCPHQNGAVYKQADRNP